MLFMMSLVQLEYGEVLSCDVTSILINYPTRSIFPALPFNRPSQISFNICRQSEP